MAGTPGRKEPGRAALREDREGVLAADAVAEAGDVSAVDVHGDGHAVTGVAHPVDISGWREAAYHSGQVHVPGGAVEGAPAVGQRKDLFVLTTLQHAGDAPGHVVMNHRLLAGQPDHGGDRERAVRLGVEQVALIAGRIAAAQRRGKELRRSEERRVGEEGRVRWG